MPSKKSLSFRLIIGLMLTSLFLSNFSLILAKKAQAQESEPVLVSQPAPVDQIIQPVDNLNDGIFALPLKEITKPAPQPIILEPVEEPITQPIVEEPTIEPIIDLNDPLVDENNVNDDITDQLETTLSEDDNGTVDMYANRDNAGKQPKDKVGSYNVDELTGLFSYAYPLAIPKGRANLQPDISLQYNHRQVNVGSMVGFGWEISMPSVSRDNRSGVDNLYNEKYIR